MPRSVRDRLYLAPIWIVHPLTLAGLGVGLSVVPPLTASSTQQLSWGVSWYLQAQDYWIIIGSGLILLLGVIVGIADVSGATKRSTGSTQVSVTGLRRAIGFTFGLYVLGYVVWLLAGVVHGLTLTTAARALLGDPGAAYVARAALETVPGLSTLTEVGPVLAALLIVSWRLGEKRRPLLLTVLVMSVARTFLNSERLAIVEIVLPMVLVVTLTRPPLTATRRELRRRRRWIYRIFALAPVALFGLFVVTERGRSWASHYQSSYGGGLLSFSFDRLWAYYATAANNGSIYAHYYVEHLSFPSLSLEAVYKAPLLGDLLSLGGGSVATPLPWVDFLGQFSNPEFNNTSTFLPVVSELGFGLASILFFGWGFLMGRAYVGFVRGSVVGLCAYASFGIGLLELARYPYFSSGRAVPGLIALAVLARCLRGNTAKRRQPNLRESEASRT